MSKKYCVTMELTQRVGFDIRAKDDTDAMAVADHSYEELIQRPRNFNDGDMESTYELAEADGRPVIPWTKPMFLEWPDGKKPKDSGWAPPSGGHGQAYRMTAERRTLIAEWFEADDDQAAEAEAEKIAFRYNADPSLFLSGDSSHDYALNDSGGRTLVSWN